MPGTLVSDLRDLRFGPFQAILAVMVVAGTVFLLATPYYFFALLTGPLILALFFLGRNPRLAWYLLVFLIPAEFLTRLVPTQPGITVSKLLGIWIVVVALLMLLMDVWRVRHLKSALWPFLVAFVVVNVAATLITSHLANALAHLYQLLVAIVIFALTLLLTNRNGFASVIPSILIWGVLLNYVIFLLDFRLGVTMPWVAESPFPRDVHLPGYAMPTGYSTYLVFVLPFLIHRMAFSKGLMKKAVYFGLIFLGLSGVMYLGSRAAFVLVLFLVAFLCLQYLRFLRPRLIGLMAAGVLLSASLVLLLMPDWYMGRQKSMVETKTDVSIRARVDLMNAGWELFKQRPFLGFGPGNFSEEYAHTPYAPEYATAIMAFRMAAHNTYIEVLVGSGLLGLFCFLGLILVALMNYRKAAKTFRLDGNRERELLTNSYLSVFLVNLLFFFFISMLTMKHFWIFLAISQLALNYSKTKLPSELDAA